ncbi:hypothetical protein [Amycolatopsis sp. FDAARGOS 1241]|uniref:hypothetical protein n=1 Tax=Amycolatopsis sp. FDAARGOS 1241 TaxID=2778070 RepID=UPI00194E7A94|nr:hypothetical protein [Amycolatopsis sp. FDAARGOS 1241]QRP43069.1 hypothetical protein I6J71_26965 [Amycolatopsis sp. FDAARGOS 1241]
MAVGEPADRVDLQLDDAQLPATESTDVPHEPGTARSSRRTTVESAGPEGRGGRTRLGGGTTIRYKYIEKESVALKEFVEEVHRLKSEQRKREQNLEQPPETRSAGDL